MKMVNILACAGMVTGFFLILRLPVFPKNTG